MSSLSFDFVTPILIIAQSARMLAQLAVAAGFRVVTIDCFNDLDTQQLALRSYQTSSFKLADIKNALLTIQQDFKCHTVAYGSGVEYQLDTIAFLEENFLLLGNSSALLQRLQNKADFFLNLLSLAIPYPETVFSEPDYANDWLIKPITGQGGCNITRFKPNSAQHYAGFYWQQHIQGQPMSVTFLASEKQFTVLGINCQWTITQAEELFLFAGIANNAIVSQANQSLLCEWIAKLLTIYPLRGLASLDFILLNNNCYVLEINPRVPASAQLYTNDIFIWHYLACIDQFDAVADSQQIDPLYKAYEIIYAKADLLVSKQINWPNWVRDIPVSGVFIGRGQPICSIICTETSLPELNACLSIRRQIIENILITGS